MATQQTTTPATLPETGYIRIRKLIQIIPFSTATIWRKVKNGSFPKPVKLSENSTAWRVEDVRAWMQARNIEAVKTCQLNQ